MNNKELIAKRDLFIYSVIEKYGEWLEMTNEPECMLIDILSSLLMKAEDEIKYLKSIAYKE